tara:strand:+ start:311 stop:553 length:243 start_codon:yes stop_codon:yes gene_type:complete
MKIVKFKDGSYGVRRRHWLFGYEFYMMGNGPGCWSSMKDVFSSNAPWIKVESLIAAQDRLKHIKHIKHVKADDNDKGVAV